MPAIDLVYYIRREADFSGSPAYSLIAKPGTPLYSSGFDYNLYVAITGVNDPPTNQYVSLAAAEAAFQGSLQGNVVDLINAAFGTSLTVGGLVKFETSIQDAINAAIVTPSSSQVSHALNTAFQASTTRPFDASYSVDITTVLSLTSGQSGTVFLEICASSGFASGVSTLDEFTSSNTGTLAVGLGLTKTVTAKLLASDIPAGSWVRLRTANNVGSPTFTFKRGRETIR